MIDFPDRKYQIILADPPWKYLDKANAGERGASHKYSTMSLEELKALPVGDIAAPNCALFLWVTYPQLITGLEVMKAWGFKYKTVAFTWVKRNKKEDTWFMGMGSWTRANAEFCLLGIRGRPKRLSKSVRSIVDARIQEHSRKPWEVRERIVELLGDLSRIELFATERIRGWESWGDAVE